VNDPGSKPLTTGKAIGIVNQLLHRIETTGAGPVGDISAREREAIRVLRDYTVNANTRLVAMARAIPRVDATK